MSDFDRRCILQLLLILNQLVDAQCIHKWDPAWLLSVVWCFFEKSVFELPICRLVLFTVCVAILQLPVGLWSFSREQVGWTIKMGVINWGRVWYQLKVSRDCPSRFTLLQLCSGLGSRICHKWPFQQFWSYFCWIKMCHWGLRAFVTAVKTGWSEQHVGKVTVR